MGLFDRFKRKKEEKNTLTELGIEIDPNGSKEYKEEMKRIVDEHNERVREDNEYHENLQNELKAVEEYVDSIIEIINRTPSIKETVESCIEELREIGFGESKIKYFKKIVEEKVKENKDKISRGSKDTEELVKMSITAKKNAMITDLNRSKKNIDMQIEGIRKDDSLSETEKEAAIEDKEFYFKVFKLGTITDINEYIEQTKKELLETDNYSKEQIESFIDEIRKYVDEKLKLQPEDTSFNINLNNDKIADIISRIKQKTNALKKKTKNNQASLEEKIEKIRNIELDDDTEKFRQILNEKFNNNYEEAYKNRRIELEKNRHDFLEGKDNKKELIDSYLRCAELYGCFDSAKEEIRARLEGVEGNNKKDINFKMSDITNGFIKRKNHDLEQYLLHANLLKEVKDILKYEKPTLEFIRELLSKTSEEVEELLDNADKKVKEEFDKKYENLSPIQRLNKYGIPLPYKNRLDLHAPESYSEDDEARRKQELEMILSEDKMRKNNASGRRLRR